MSVSDFVSDVSINGGLTVASDTSLNGSLFVASDTSLNGKLFVGDGGTIGGLTAFTGIVTYDNFMISNATNQMNGSTTYNGNTTFAGKLTANEMTINEAFIAKKDAIYQSNMQVSNDLDVIARAFIKKDVEIAQGNVTIGKNLVTSGNALINGNTIINGDLSLNGQLKANDIDVTFGPNSIPQNSVIDRNDFSNDASGLIISKMGLDKTVIPKVTIDLSGATDAIKLPRGTTAERPDLSNNDQGYIRYNAETSQFEGYGAGGAWGSLGGVTDVDQDTFVSAETAAGDDNDELKFFTAGSERMVIDACGNIGIKNSTPTVTLDLSGASDAVKLPIGTTAHRPDTSGNDGLGYIRYNTETSQFEGYGAGNTWGSLGGVTDVDQDTKIVAEVSAGADNDALQFITAGSERLTITSEGDLSLNKSIVLNKKLPVGMSEASFVTVTPTKSNLSANSWSTVTNGVDVAWNVSHSGAAVTASNKVFNAYHMFDASFGNTLDFSTLSTDTSGNFVDASGVVVRDASGNSVDASGNAVVKITEVGYITEATTYNPVTGIYEGILNTPVEIIGDVSGEFIDIASDVSFNISSFHFKALDYAGFLGAHLLPNKFTFAGYNEINTRYEPIMRVTHTGAPTDNSFNAVTDEYTKLTTTDVSANESAGVGTKTRDVEYYSTSSAVYKKYRLIIEEKSNTTTDYTDVINRNFAGIGEWVITGTSPDPSTIVFTYEDSTANITMNSVDKDTLDIDGNLNVSGVIRVGGKIYLEDTVLSGDISLNDTLIVGGEILVNHGLIVAGDASLNAGLDVSGATVLNSTLVVIDDVSFNKGLSVGGDLSLNGPVALSSTLSVVDDVSFNKGLSVAGDVSLNNKLFINDASGVIVNTSILPETDNTISLGSAEKRFTELHVKEMLIGTDTLNFYSASAGKVVGSLSFDTSKNVLDLSANGKVGESALLYDSKLSLGKYDNSSPVHELDVSGSAGITSTLDVSGATILDSTVKVTGATTLENTVDISGATALASTLDVSGATVLDSTVKVTGSAALASTLDVSGATVLDSTVKVTGAAALASTLDVSGATVLDSTVKVTGAAVLASTLDVSGATVLDSTVKVTGAAALASTLDVTGATGITSTLDVSGATVLHDTVNVTGAAALASTLDVSKATGLASTLDVSGASVLHGAITAQDQIMVHGTTFLNTNTYISGPAALLSTLDVEKATLLRSTLDVTGATALASTLDVSGATVLDSTVNVTEAATLSSTLDVSKATTLSSTLAVSKETSLSSTLDVSGATVLESTVNVIGAAALDSTLNVSGATVLDNTVTVTGKTTFDNDVSLNARMDIQGDISLNSSLTVTGALTVDGPVKLTEINNEYVTNINTTSYELIVAEDLSLNGNFMVADDVSFNGGLFVKETAVLGGDLSLNSGFSVNGDVSLNAGLNIQGSVELGGDISLNAGISVQSDSSFNGRLFVADKLNVNGISIGRALNDDNTTTVVGNNAASNLSDAAGIHNTAIGFQSLAANVEEPFNTSVGSEALKLFNGGTAGQNTAIGASALAQTTVGVQNIALGYQAGFDNKSGDQNIFIGNNAGVTDENGSTSGAVAIGYNAKATKDNQTFIKNDDVYFDVVNDISGTAGKLHIGMINFTPGGVTGTIPQSAISGLDGESQTTTGDHIIEGRAFVGTANTTGTSVFSHSISVRKGLTVTENITGSSGMEVEGDASFNSNVSMAGVNNMLSFKTFEPVEVAGAIDQNTQYTDPNYTTYTEVTNLPTNTNIQFIKTNTDGQHVMAYSTDASGSIMISNDYGITYSSVPIESLDNSTYEVNRRAAMSLDGRYMVIVGNNIDGTGYIYHSTNFGASFTSALSTSALTYTCATMSGNGQNIFVGTNNEKLYVSTDFGVSIGPHASAPISTAGISGTDVSVAGPNINWRHIITNNNGRYTIAFTDEKVFLSKTTDTNFNNASSWEDLDLNARGLNNANKYPADLTSAYMTDDGAYAYLAFNDKNVYRINQNQFNYGSASTSWVAGNTLDIHISHPDSGRFLVAATTNAGMDGKFVQLIDKVNTQPILVSNQGNSQTANAYPYNPDPKLDVVAGTYRTVAISGNGAYTYVATDSAVFVKQFNDGTTVQVETGEAFVLSKDMSLNERVFVNGDVIARAGFEVTSDVSFNSNLFVAGDASMNSKLFVGGDVSMNSKLFVDGDASMNSNLSVAGDASLNSNLFVAGKFAVDKILIEGDASMNAKLFVAGDASMNSILSVGGKLIVDDDASMNSTLSVGGDVSFDSDLHLSGNMGINKQASSDIVLDISASNALRLPKGETSERPVQNDADASYKGIIRYNSSTDQFEGFGAGQAWGSLGGVIDVDQDTYIKAETAAGVDNDSLQFFTADENRMTITKTGDVSMNQKLIVDGDASFNSNLSVNGTLNVTGAVNLTEYNNEYITNIDTTNYTLIVTEDLSLNGNMKVNGTAQIDGEVTLNDNVSIADAKTLTVGTGASSLGGSLTVTGETTLNDNVSVAAGKTLTVGTGASSLGGTLDVEGDVKIKTDKFVVTAASGNTAIAGTLDVDSNTVIKGSLTVGAGGDEFTITESSDDITLANTIQDKDVVFTANNGGSQSEFLRLDGSEGELKVSKDIIPSSSNVSLGSAGNPFKDIYVSQNSIVFGDSGSAQVSKFAVNTSTGKIAIQKTDSTGADDGDPLDYLIQNDAATITTLTTTGDISANTAMSLGGALVISKADGNLASPALHVASYTRIDGTLSLMDAGTGLEVIGGSTLSSVRVIGDTSMNGLYAGGDATFNSDISANGNMSIGGDVSFNGAIEIAGDISWNSANIPNDSIPPTAIIGGVGSNHFTEAVIMDSSLFINGDISFNSNLHVGGHMVPRADNAYDIGSADNRIRDLFISESSIYLGEQNKISVSATGDLQFNKIDKTVIPASLQGISGVESAILTFTGKASIDLVTIAEYLAYAIQSGETVNGKTGDAITANDIYTSDASNFASVTAADPTSNDLSLNAAFSVGGHALFTSDVSFNSGINIAGDISWNSVNIPDNSIPQTAIIGGVGSSTIDGDLTVKTGFIKQF